MPSPPESTRPSEASAALRQALPTREARSRVDARARVAVDDEHLGRRRRRRDPSLTVATVLPSQRAGLMWGVSVSTARLA